MTIGILYFFVEWCFKIMHNKFQVNLTKIEGVLAIFVISPVTITIVYRYVVILRLGAKGPQHGRKCPQQGPKVLQVGLKGPWSV